MITNRRLQNALENAGICGEGKTRRKNQGMTGNRRGITKDKARSEHSQVIRSQCQGGEKSRKRKRMPGVIVGYTKKNQKERNKEEKKRGDK